MREIIHKDILGRVQLLSERFQQSQPFKHLVLDDFLDPSFCRSLIGEFPPYDEKKFLNEHGHRGKAHQEKVRDLGPHFSQLDDCVRSASFLSFMSSVTGIANLMYDPSYFGGGTHENLEDMELDPHVDFNWHPETGLYRRVNFLLYLNPEWDESWGGALELHTDPWLPRDQDQIKIVLPLMNRCVIFETSEKSWHGFQKIEFPKDKILWSRRSLALYLYTQEPPECGIIPSDLTVFVDRPLPNYFKSGHLLSEKDVALLERLITRRDWKLKYLYDRSLFWAREALRLKDKS